MRQLFAVLLLALTCWHSAQAAVGQEESTLGSLVIMGGSERFRNRDIWEELRDLAGGSGAKVAVFPTACSDPIKDVRRVIATLEKFELEPFVVPLAPQGFDQQPADVLKDPRWIRQVREADCVFFLGGRQDRIVDTLLLPNGEKTPLLEAVWSVYRRGGVIAGTSAGAAIMSHQMFRDGPNPLNAMRQGLSQDKELGRGLGFLDHDWFVDQHALVRGRFARTIAAMHALGLEYGIGVDENTALIVENGNKARVVGHKGVLLLKLSDAQRDRSIKSFNLRNVQMSYLDQGDSIDLNTHKVTPAIEKMDDQFLDPNADDFEPYYNHKMFYADILGNCVVPELLGRLIDNQQSEAIGLAFNAGDAASEPSEGFEFRFYRGKDSVGWFTTDYGGEDYTVLNIHLDIKPIRITGPLYTHYQQMEAAMEEMEADMAAGLISTERK